MGKWWLTRGFRSTFVFRQSYICSMLWDNHNWLTLWGWLGTTSQIHMVSICSGKSHIHCQLFVSMKQRWMLVFLQMPSTLGLWLFYDMLVGLMIPLLCHPHIPLWNAWDWISQWCHKKWLVSHHPFSVVNQCHKTTIFLDGLQKKCKHPTDNKMAMTWGWFMALRDCHI